MIFKEDYMVRKVTVSDAFLASLKPAERGIGNDLGYDVVPPRRIVSIVGFGDRLESHALPSSPETVARLTAEVAERGLEKFVNRSGTS